MDWILNNPLVWQIGLVVLPFLLPNKVVYQVGRKTFGKLIKLFTVTQEGKLPKGKSVLAYLLNTIAVFFEGGVDEIRNAPDKYVKKD